MYVFALDKIADAKEKLDKSRASDTLFMTKGLFLATKQ